MSWGRTVLALVAVALMFVRWYPVGGPWALLPAAGAAVGGAVVLSGQRRRYRRQTEGIAVGRVRPAVRAVIGMTAMAVGLAGLAFAALLMGS